MWLMLTASFVCPSYSTTTLLTNRINIYLVGSDKKKLKISAALLPFIQLLRSRIICGDTCWCFVNTRISGGQKSLFLSAASATCASCLTSQTRQSRDLFEKGQTCSLIILVRGRAHISPRRRRHSSGYILAAWQGQRFGNRYWLRRFLSDSFCKQCLKGDVCNFF